MKRWIRLAVNLYPRPWRERYGVEFHALLDDVHPGWREFLNVVGGALKMRLTNGLGYWKLAAVFAIAGAIVAAGVSFRADRRYVSSATLRITAPQPIDGSYRLQTILSSVLSDTNLIRVITDPRLDLYQEERTRAPMSKVVEHMRQAIHVLWLPGTTTGLRVSFAYRDREKAQATVRILVDQFIRQNSRENRFRASSWKLMSDSIGPQVPAPPDEEIALLDAASLPEKPVRSNLLAYVALGLAAGLLLGLVTAVTLRRPKWTLKLAGFAVAGALLMAVVSFLPIDTFSSTAVVRISHPTIPAEPYDPSTISGRFHAIEQQVLSDSGLTAIAEKNELKLYRSGKDVAKMRRDLRVRLMNPPTGFVVSFSYPDRFKAQRTVNAVVSGFEETYSRAKRAEAKGSPAAEFLANHRLGIQYETVDPANLPEVPNGPNRLGMTVAGLGAGLLLGGLKLRRPTFPRPRPA